MIQAEINNYAPPARGAQKIQVKTNSKAILPPYGALVDRFKKEDGLIVCTGSGGWDLAKSKSWIAHMPKIVLPFGNNPNLYKWPAHHREVMICSFGESESYQSLIKLSKCLLKQGAIWVLWSIKGYPLTKIERPSMEAVA